VSAGLWRPLVCAVRGLTSRLSCPPACRTGEGGGDAACRDGRRGRCRRLSGHPALV